MRAKIKLLRDGAQIPTLGSDKAAGLDMYACIDGPVEINPGETAKVGTGVAITPPAGYFGAIFARSGLATKQGLRPANCVGVCDEDYTGEYIIPIYNDSEFRRTICSGDRIAQLVFLPYIENIGFDVVDDLESTKRGAGGFGSTGI